MLAPPGGGAQGFAGQGAHAAGPGLSGVLDNSGKEGGPLAGDLGGGVSIQGLVGQVGGDSDGAWRGAAGAAGSGGGLSRGWVLEALACHTAGDSCEDLAVAQLRQQEPLQVCGVRCVYVCVLVHV